MMAAKKKTSRRSKRRRSSQVNQVSAEPVAASQPEGIQAFEVREEPKQLDVPSSPAPQGTAYSFEQEAPAPQSVAMNEETTVFLGEKEKLITTFTAGGVVLSFGLSFGSVMVIPAWPAGAGLLATLGVISCIGAFMARESI